MFLENNLVIISLLHFHGNMYSLSVSWFCSQWQIRTVKVNNVSLGATENDLKEFFCFSGEIEYIEIQGLVFFSFSFRVTN